MLLLLFIVRHPDITPLSLNGDMITLLRNKQYLKFRITLAQIKPILVIGLETRNLTRMFLFPLCSWRGDFGSSVHEEGIVFVETSLVFQGNKKVITDVKSR